MLSSPNNTLGIEYCAAIDALGCDIQPITVQRDGLRTTANSCTSVRRPPPCAA
ncbi:MAG: nucleotidyltransferase family protein [Butyricicoccus pullicaecorum]